MPALRGRLRLIATLHDPTVIRKILAHLGREPRSRPRSRPAPISLQPAEGRDVPRATPAARNRLRIVYRVLWADSTGTSARMDARSRMWRPWSWPRPGARSSGLPLEVRLRADPLQPQAAT